MAAYRLTEPRIIAANAPTPREPTTSISAPDPAAVTASAGPPSRWSASISRSGAALAARAVAAVSASLLSSRMTSDTVSYADLPVLATIRGSRPAAETIRSGAPRSTASRAAQSTARSDSSEPSVAATMGFSDMLLLLAVIPSRTS